MRKIKITVAILVFWAITSIPSFGQAPPPPPDEPKGTSGNKGPGGGAPIEAGLITFVLMTTGYGGYKWLAADKKNTKKRE
jgi:hypothetical protein